MSEKIEEKNDKIETKNETKAKAKKTATEDKKITENKTKKQMTTKETTKKTEDKSKEDTKSKSEDKGTNNKTKKNNTTKKETTENENNLELTKTKNEKNILTIKQQKELETIEKEMKSQEELEKKKMSTTYVSILKNILYAIIEMLYFIVVIICKNYIEPNMFITVLKVFSMVLIFTTICVFEIAYKKDSGKLAVTGIEFLVISICTLISIRTYILFNSKFVSSIASFGLLFAIYYVGKAIRIYLKEKKKIKKEVNNIVT